MERETNLSYLSAFHYTSAALLVLTSVFAAEAIVRSQPQSVSFWELRFLVTFYRPRKIENNLLIR